ncbi:MAG: hypothetical protein KDD36_12935 [Flavobacteriales bacterium]|nr:hypothetical protein [Flavobacteriales bacterium]
MIYDVIGYIGLSLNLYAMYTKGEYRLRLFSAIANFIYIIYGILINALPIVAGCTIAVVLHLIRLRTLR